MTEETAVVVAKPRKVGRPGHLTPEVQERFLLQLRKGISVRYAARLAGLNPDVTQKWIDRGRGRIPDRPAAPEYVAFVEAIEDAKSHLIGELAGYILEGAKQDPLLALRLADRIDPDWMGPRPLPEPDDRTDEDDRAYLRPGGGGAVADVPEEDAPIQLTERTRTVSIPAARLTEFTRALRGKDPDDPSARLSRFRETEGDVPPT